MGDVIYHLFVILVAALGIIVGYRRGFVKQISSVLAVAFGLVCARAFAYIPADWLWGIVGKFITDFNAPFVIKTLSATIIYLFTYGIVRLATFLIMKLVRILPTGLFNSIVGAVFCLFKLLIFVSLFYNLIVDINPHSSMLKYAANHDGNVVEGVMWLAPALMGFPDGEDLAHALQLEDAKTIS